MAIDGFRPSAEGAGFEEEGRTGPFGRQHGPTNHPRRTARFFEEDVTRVDMNADRRIHETGPVGHQDLRAKQAAAPDMTRVWTEAFQHLSGLHNMTVMLGQEIDAFAKRLADMAPKPSSVVRSGDGTHPRHTTERDRQPGPEVRSVCPDIAAEKAAQAVRQRPEGPVGGPGTSLR